MTVSLITGVAGFAGSHLAERLVAEGHQVVGISMPGEDLKRLDGLKGKIELRSADITDRLDLKTSTLSVRPDYVFHLAALASVANSFGAPALAFRVNTLGTVNLLETLRPHPPEKFIYISSADVYGAVAPSRVPIRETEPPRPASPYAASKAAAEVACLQYWRTYAMPVVILRPFNHTGPRQAPGFAPSDFARAIARIEKGLDPASLPVGNLDSRRDYSDARDIVRAYALAALRCEPGEVYNVSSGRAVRIGDLLSALLALSSAEIKIVPDPERARPSDSPIVVGDHSKFSRRTGWQPSVPFETTLFDLLAWHRAAIQSI